MGWKPQDVEWLHRLYSAGAAYDPLDHPVVRREFRDANIKLFEERCPDGMLPEPYCIGEIGVHGKGDSSPDTCMVCGIKCAGYGWQRPFPEAVGGKWWWYRVCHKSCQARVEYKFHLYRKIAGDVRRCLYDLQVLIKEIKRNVKKAGKEVYGKAVKEGTQSR